LEADQHRAWVLVEQPDHRVLGGALAWAHQRGARQLDLIVDGAPEPLAAAVARRATTFATPVHIWRVDGRQLLAVQPAPFSPPPPIPPEVATFADVLWAHGAEPVVEFGVLTGEVLGLEVARVVVDNGVARLEVGVGRHDREAQRLLFPERPVEESLAQAVTTVRRMRTADAPPHLANRLAGERWLRSVVIARPQLVGAVHLVPAPPPLPRADLLQPLPAPAAGVDQNDRAVLVVCSTGIDPNLVPAAADARLADGRSDCRLILVVPEGDDHPITRALAANLRQPADVVTVPAGWRALSPVP
jgi:hypothetical protein